MRALILFAAGLGIATGAQAWDGQPSGYYRDAAGGYWRDGGGDGYYRDDGDSGYYRDGGEVRHGWGEVLEVTPVYRTTGVPQSREVCYEEPVQYYREGRPRSAGGALLGAVIGGVIGNQIGRGGGSRHGYHRHGPHRDASTAAGAAIGAAIGYQASRGPAQVSHGYEQRCRLERDWQRADELVGYDVTYRYRGEIYQTRTDHDPGDSIRVQVAVTPVR